MFSGLLMWIVHYDKGDKCYSSEQYSISMENELSQSWSDSYMGGVIWMNSALLKRTSE